MEKMLTLYRMEDERGLGPWNGSTPMGVPYFWLTGRPVGEDLPTPYHKPEYRPAGVETARLRSAAPSLSALGQWFDAEDRRRLAQVGLSLHAYEVPEDATASDGIQISFDVTKAKRIATLDPVSLAPISAE